ncbi:MAG: hypothetical protein R3B70_33930 [Polyangiaceae bacterium]
MTVSEMLTAPANCGGASVQIAEVVQCGDCAPGSADLSPTGWMIEWIDADGHPVCQDWWLTASYEYPSAAMKKRTLLRTLNDAEKAVSAQHTLAKHIAVSITPPPSGPDLSGLPANMPVEDYISTFAGPPVHGECPRGFWCATQAAGAGGAGGALGLSSGLALAVALLRRRRRPRG